MLFQLVERICAKIDALPEGAYGEPVLAQQIAQNAPDTIKEFISANRGAGTNVTPEQAARICAALAFTMIRSIPRIARAMVAKVQDRRVPAERRAAIASVLAFLVQPHDFIHDDTAAQYGYLDDAILLNAGLVAYLDTLPAQDASATVRMVGLAIQLTPAPVRPALLAGVSSLSQLVQMLAMMGPEIAEGTLSQIVAYPLQASAAVAAPAGFSPQPARNYGAGHWSGGAYFEGNNVIMGGGGPALIDGQLFIPG